MKRFIIYWMALISIFFPTLIGNLSPTPLTLDDIFKQAGSRYEIDWRLVKAVAIVESKLDPNAMSKDKRDIGIMQIGITLAQLYNLKGGTLFDPYINIHIGASHLSYLIQKHGLKKGIQMYNTGEASYLRGTRVIFYYNRVMRNYWDLIRPT